MASPRRQQAPPDDAGGYDDDDRDYVDDDHRAIVAFADSFLDEDERGDFVNHLMERRGYQRVESWGPRAEPAADPEPPARAPSSRGGGSGGRRSQGYFKR